MKEIFDLHNDFLTDLKSNRVKKRYLNNKVNKTTNIVSAVWTSKLNQEESIKNIETCYSFIAEHNMNSKSQLNLAIEDMHFLTKNYLDRIINMRPIYCGLTWNSDNVLAGGAIEGGDFSGLGLDVVRCLEKENIQIDTAHLSERSFMTFSKITERPILCSHTAVARLKGHVRNLKDYQLKMIVESGGLIGVCLVGDFLVEEKKCRVGDVARHIDYIVSRFGDQNIAIGTDFYGTTNLPKGIKDYKDLSLLEDRLEMLGYSEETIDNIFYKNAQKFFKNF